MHKNIIAVNRKAYLTLIDEHKNKLIDPVEMLKWTYLRVFINNISDEDFERTHEKAMEVCSQ